MKIIFSAFYFLFFSLIALGQSPQAIPYQSVVRDSAGNIIANRNIKLRFSIHDITATGIIIYRESHNTMTNLLGLCTVEIGRGISDIGTFSLINWGTNAKYIEIELDENATNSYVTMGTNQFLSVPYALYSSSSGSVGPSSVDAQVASNNNLDTTTSTSFVDIPLMNLMTSNNSTRPYLINFSCSLRNTRDNAIHNIILVIDGVIITSTERIVINQSPDHYLTLSTNYIAQLSSGKSIKVQVKTAKGILTIANKTLTIYGMQ